MTKWTARVPGLVVLGWLGSVMGSPLRAGCPVDPLNQSEVRVINQSGDNIYVFDVADFGPPGVAMPDGGQQDFCYDPSTMSFSFTIQSGTDGGYNPDATRWSKIGVGAPGDSCLIYLLFIDPNGYWRLNGTVPKPCHGAPSAGARPGVGSSGGSGGGQGSQGGSQGPSQSAIDYVNKEHQRLFDQVKQGRVTASAALAQLDAAAQKSGATSGSNWQSFRSSCASDFQRAEQYWRSNQQQQAAAQAAEAQRQQQLQIAAQQQEQQRRLQEEQRRQEAIRKYQADMAAAAEDQRRKAEEFQRQQKAELQRKLDALNERNQRLQEINQANQQIVSSAFGEGVSSAETAIGAKRSAMVSSVVGNWKAPKSYGRDAATGVELVDPFAAAPAAPSVSAVEVEPSGEVTLEFVKGPAPRRQVLLASADGGFRPVACEPVPGSLRVTIEPVPEGERRADHSPRQFVVTVTAAGRAPSAPTKQSVRIATGLTAQPLIELSVTVARK